MGATGDCGSKSGLRLCQRPPKGLGSRLVAGSTACCLSEVPWTGWQEVKRDLKEKTLRNAGKKWVTGCCPAQEIKKAQGLKVKP